MNPTQLPNMFQKLQKTKWSFRPNDRIRRGARVVYGFLSCNVSLAVSLGRILPVHIRARHKRAIPQEGHIHPGLPLSRPPFLPLRVGTRRLYKNDGSFLPDLPEAEDTEDTVFHTASTRNYHIVTTGDIRVLSLLPGLFDDPLRCQLAVEPIEQQPMYDVLSCGKIRQTTGS